MTTKKKRLAVMKSIWLHTRYLAFVHASLAQIMSWLSTLHFWLQLKSSSSSGELMKFIFIRLTFPVFEFHNFLFKIAYPIGEKRLFLLAGERNFIRLKNYGGTRRTLSLRSLSQTPMGQSQRSIER